MALLILGSPILTAACARGPDAVAALDPMPPVAGTCTRPPESSEIQNPPALYSRSGVLSVALSFQTTTDPQGRTLFCFLTADGLQNPALHVLPGDTLVVTVTNNTPQGDFMMTLDAPCNDAQMYMSSTNIHYHGTNVSPACGSDEVIQTVVNSGEAYQYTLDFPADEPSGLYWYHPHVHGVSDPMVMGGATGALVVDGIENFQPGVLDMTWQTIVIRDQRQFANLPEGPGNCGFGVPFRDVTVNDVPVNSHRTSLHSPVVIFKPAMLTVPPNAPQFWRVANTSADTILDLRVVYDQVPQTLYLVAIDGVPVNSQDGTGPSSFVPVTNFRLPPASRVEFVVDMPPADVGLAMLLTNNIDTGPDGDCDPTRPLIVLNPSGDAKPRGPDTQAIRALPAGNGRRFAGLKEAPVTAQRTVFFAENNAAEQFFMTVQGQPNKLFDPNQPPGIVTTQGAVEQWTVQNQTLENHEFHIHQIHFLVQSQNFSPQAPGITGQYLDMIEVPAWSGSGPYPSVTLLMDFRGAVVGDFVFHCHILNHEDNGMMNIIRVLPANGAKAVKARKPPRSSAPAKPEAKHRH